MNRRSFIRVSTSAGFVFLSGSALSSCADRPALALEPWQGPSSLLDSEDVRLRILSFGLLAPSFRNLQPWWADVKYAGIVVSAESSRMPTALDPSMRQTMISLGCFLETLSIAATSYGHNLAFHLRSGHPEGLEADESSPLARCELQDRQITGSDPLFGAIRKRRTNRREFYETSLREDHATALAATSLPGEISFHLVTDRPSLSDIADTVRIAEHRERSDASAREELLAQLRIEPAEVGTGRDGMLLENTGMPPLDRAWFRTKQTLGISEKRSILDALPGLLEVQTRSAAAYGALVTEQDGETDRIMAGRAFMRIHLEATRLGVALQPFSRPSDTDEGQKNLRRVFDAGPRTVQIIFRLGYGPDVPPSPRRSLFEVVRI